MLKAFKIKLHPNNKQQTLLFKCFGTSRFAYNYCLQLQIDNYKQGNNFICDGDIRKSITQLKKLPEYQWLKEVSAQIPKQAVKDCCKAFKIFFKGQAQFPKFKKKKQSYQSFFQREDKIKFINNKVMLEKIGWVKLSEKDRIPQNIKYYNPRVSFDGLNFYLSVTIECNDKQITQKSIQPIYQKAIGIDVGLKTLAVCSNGMKFKKLNVKKEQKKLKRLQKRASRYYFKMKEGEYPLGKSARLKKLEKQILKTHKRINNILTNNIHQMTSTLIKLNPQAIVVEDLNIKGMLKNRHLSQKIQESKFYEIYRQLEYKSNWNGTKFIIADRFYPSSKKCSRCGNIKKQLSLSKRTYVCECCGLVIDRDENASINLENLAY